MYIELGNWQRAWRRVSKAEIEVKININKVKLVKK
jgi:hypothetical protein